MEGKGRKAVTERVITYWVSFMRWRRKVEPINASGIMQQYQSLFIISVAGSGACY